MTENLNQRIQWVPTGAHRELCLLKGKSEDQCHNYIRVGAKLSDSELQVCGTNAYRPSCRVYKLSDVGVQLKEKEMEGHGRCPYDPSHNSTFLYQDGQLYTATVADFSGGDPLIYKEPLRTERSDLKQLNEPNFVSSVGYNDFVLFFFRETAVEHINCGKAIFSRVARVCKKDKGGPHLFGDRWTTFLKARLNCSVPGDYPFYFDEIQATSDIIKGEYNRTKGELIYGVFTTPPNAIGGSAVCAFNLTDLIATFDGPFKEQKSMNYNWLPVAESEVPKPRPGQCVNDSRTLPDSSVNFIKSHTLMDKPVSNHFSMPILIRISSQYRFTAIAVDPQVETKNGTKYDVLFIGTDDGRILKAINILIGDEIRSEIIEEIQILSPGRPITNLKIVTDEAGERKLLIISDWVVETISVHRCHVKASCFDCINLQDPYCGWDYKKGRCVPNNQFTLQNVEYGIHKDCPSPDRISNRIPNILSRYPSQKDLSESNSIDPADPPCSKAECPVCDPINCPSESAVRPAQDKIVIYTADTLGVAVLTSVLATLVVGFVAGYLCSRHFRHDPFASMSLHSNQPLNRLNESSNIVLAEGGNSNSYLTNKNNINMLVNVSNNKNNDNNEKNLTLENNKTLQKVKKTYI